MPVNDAPTKRAVGTWSEAYTKATSALAKLSQNEKIGIVTGTAWQSGKCVGNTSPANSIGYPSLCLQGESTQLLLIILITLRFSVNHSPIDIFPSDIYQMGHSASVTYGVLLPSLPGSMLRALGILIWSVKGDRSSVLKQRPLVSTSNSAPLQDLWANLLKVAVTGRALDLTLTFKLVPRRLWG